ncbi:heme-binding protein [Bosea caraganae]|uniref:Heme-binding protein n=1 Tax=Bosea caraganae TaxID=2763117 RepID=A0A370KXI7_9HYPH|nr:heme-binding protein [Bosea caraganae]RDJ19688.1 heme-binding protein [Bosea caraganae]RDJ24332.1 heme-binding protein [Bosea caraganae]
MTAQPTKFALTQPHVRAALAAGEAAALAAAARVSIAVVDDGGHLLGFVRMDEVHTGTVEVALAKARSAAGFRKPTRDLAQSLAAGMTALLTLPGCLPIPGGVPLCVGGQVAGAIGVSGASPDTDDAIARAAAGATP